MIFIVRVFIFKILDAIKTVIHPKYYTNYEKIIDMLKVA